MYRTWAIAATNEAWRVIFGPLRQGPGGPRR